MFLKLTRIFILTVQSMHSKKYLEFLKIGDIDGLDNDTDDQGDKNDDKGGNDGKNDGKNDGSNDDNEGPGDKKDKNNEGQGDNSGKNGQSSSKPKETNRTLYQEDDTNKLRKSKRSATFSKKLNSEKIGINKTQGNGNVMNPASSNGLQNNGALKNKPIKQSPLKTTLVSEAYNKVISDYQNVFAGILGRGFSNKNATCRCTTDNGGYSENVETRSNGGDSKGESRTRSNKFKVRRSNLNSNIPETIKRGIFGPQQEIIYEGLVELAADTVRVDYLIWVFRTTHLVISAIILILRVAQKELFKMEDNHRNDFMMYIMALIMTTSFFYTIMNRAKLIDGPHKTINVTAGILDFIIISSCVIIYRVTGNMENSGNKTLQLTYNIHRALLMTLIICKIINLIILSIKHYIEESKRKMLIELNESIIKSTNNDSTNSFSDIGSDNDNDSDGGNDRNTLKNIEVYKTTKGKENISVKSSVKIAISKSATDNSSKRSAVPDSGNSSNSRCETKPILLKYNPNKTKNSLRLIDLDKEIKKPKESKFNTIYLRDHLKKNLENYSFPIVKNAFRDLTFNREDFVSSDYIDVNMRMTVNIPITLSSTLYNQLVDECSVGNSTSGENNGNPPANLISSVKASSFQQEAELSVTQTQSKSPECVICKVEDQAEQLKFKNMSKDPGCVNKDLKSDSVYDPSNMEKYSVVTKLDNSSEDKKENTKSVFEQAYKVLHNVLTKIDNVEKDATDLKDELEKIEKDNMETSAPTNNLKIENERDNITSSNKSVSVTSLEVDSVNKCANKYETSVDEMLQRPEPIKSKPNILKLSKQDKPVYHSNKGAPRNSDLASCIIKLHKDSSTLSTEVSQVSMETKEMVSLLEDASIRETERKALPEEACLKGTEAKALLEDASIKETERKALPEDACPKGTDAKDLPEDASTNRTEAKDLPEDASTKETEAKDLPEDASPKDMESKVLPEDALREEASRKAMESKVLPEEASPKGTEAKTLPKEASPKGKQRKNLPEVSSIGTNKLISPPSHPHSVTAMLIKPKPIEMASNKSTTQIETSIDLDEANLHPINGSSDDKTINSTSNANCSNERSLDSPTGNTEIPREVRDLVNLFNNDYSKLKEKELLKYVSPAESPDDIRDTTTSTISFDNSQSSLDPVDLADAQAEIDVAKDASKNAAPIENELKEIKKPAKKNKGRKRKK